MESKYYTPTIEEFHVGFECELTGGARNFKEGDDVIEYSAAWKHEVYTGAKSLSVIESILRHECIRVKYLDQEDIESLGFEYTGGLKGELNFNALKDEAISITYKANSKELSISNEDNDDIYYTLFQGTIKNKSELERVLEMIGYGQQKTKEV